MTKIMFVCHGNICRSPMAEFIFKDMLKKAHRENDFVVSSCATSTEEIFGGVGNEVYPPAKRELAKHSISCEGKRAVQLKKSDYEKYDLFIAMDDYNVRNIMRIFVNDSDNKVHKLLAFTGTDDDVSDPWYSGEFELTYKVIYEGCKALLEYLSSD